MQDNVTLKQIAEATNISKRTIERRSLRESWPSCGTTIINHNETKLYAVKDLPSDIQQHFHPASSLFSLPLPRARGEINDSSGAGILPATPAPVPARINDVPVAAIPEDARRTALARMDLLLQWESFRSRFDSLNEGDEEFTRWYQTGHGAPHLHKVLGTVSTGTLYKWKARLGGSSDWRNLVPRYKWSGMVLQTSLDLEVRRIFERFLLDPRRQKISQCIFYTREALIHQGVECDASDAVFYRYAEWYQKTHNDVWTFRREGNKALVDKVLMYIKRDAGMLEVGQVLVADGHRLNFQIINPFTGKPCRATMIAYLDWKSYDLAGYEIMIEENTQCIASALRHGMMKLGKRPRFCSQDNGKAFRSKYFTNCPSFEESGFVGLFARFNIIPVFSLPYNARAKVIERWWGIFSESFERLMPSYIGASIADKPAYMLRNEKFHRALRGEYTPTIWEAVELIDQWLSLWSTKTECPHVAGKSIRQVFDEGKGPGMPHDELDDLMMDTKITKIYQNGIRMWGEYYWHESLYGKKFDDVTVRYSIFEKSTVRVYAKNGALICTAARSADMNPLVNYLGTEAEKERFKNVIEMRGRLRKGTVHMAQQVEEAPMPIAINCSTGSQQAPRIEGPQPGALMMRQSQERRNDIETLKAGPDIIEMMPTEEPAPRLKLAMFECDLEERNL
ncbi:MAG: Mu transposase C-terminal domain-containing protein [Nitrospirae bacterium]|nr:Mu transposase C-terminal domain-containing protein [Nitrospirota bacterium]